MSAVRATITLPAKLKKQVDAELREKDITFSQFVRQLIREQQHKPAKATK